MEKQLQELKEYCVADYNNFIDNVDMQKRYEDGFTFSKGKKYIKVMNSGSAWGFIVLKDDDKFKRGDILLAASWSAPARNHARGNILEGNYSVSWTSPHYCM